MTRFAVPVDLMRAIELAVPAGAGAAVAGPLDAEFAPVPTGPLLVDADVAGGLSVRPWIVRYARHGPRAAPHPAGETALRELLDLEPTTTAPRPVVW
jgi:hypothetical protein